jgi:hypothetical protein
MSVTFANCAVQFDASQVDQVPALVQSIGNHLDIPHYVLDDEKR